MSLLASTDSTDLPFYLQHRPPPLFFAVQPLASTDPPFLLTINELGSALCSLFIAALLGLADVSRFLLLLLRDWLV